MNFLLRPTITHHQVVPEQAPARDPLPPADARYSPKPPLPAGAAATLEGLIAEGPFTPSEDSDGGDNGERPYAKNYGFSGENHSDVSDEEGWITIPYRELPEDWNDAPNIHSLRSLDRSFVFPGEQVHILACLSAYKQDMEIITPFKVAAVMSKNGVGQSPEKKVNGGDKEETNLLAEEGDAINEGQVLGQNGNDQSKQKIDLQNDISASESFLRMEDRKRQTEMLLQKFKNSHFFVRIAESGEPLWSRRSVVNEMNGQKSTGNGTKGSASRHNAFIDKGNFDANASGGAARNSVQCYSLSNGDIVVLLQVNIGVNFLRDPIIEILQFEKYQERTLSPENQENLNFANYDPCGDLLKWLIPLDNTLPPARSLSPPHLSSNSGIGGASQKSASSGSQIFSHFRSYSMSSLPQNAAPPPQPVKPQSSRTSLDVEDWGQYSSQKLWKNQRTVGEGLLTFRGVSLERERFSVRCGLEGIYIPGRRWRRKLELIQPVEIHSFAADCNTDDLICVQIKNVSPANTPDIVVYIDAISIVFEEASKGGPPSSLPISCTEAGNDHCLPNLALRRGEEHSFILKPASSTWKNNRLHGQKISPQSSLQHAPNTIERKSSSNADQYAIMVSCRCNYTESRLFFKQPIIWRPRVSRDLMISVASEMSGQFCGPNGRVSQLPVQVLTLRASNLTPEDLTLTVLAPASFTSPPSVGSLSSPASPMSPFVSVTDSTGRLIGDRHGTAVQRLSSAPSASENEKQNVNSGVQSVSFNGQCSPISDVIPSTGFGCTHLWLQSRVPLGCVPAQSTATIKLELLPLTDGIITLDTLQIDVKEKGLAYIPEHSLKINATSSISTRIM